MATDLELGGKEHSNPIPWSLSLGHSQLPLHDLGDNDSTCYGKDKKYSTWVTLGRARPSLSSLLRYSCDPSHYTSSPRGLAPCLCAWTRITQMTCEWALECVWVWMAPGMRGRESCPFSTKAFQSQAQVGEMV